YGYAMLFYDTVSSAVLENVQFKYGGMGYNLASGTNNFIRHVVFGTCENGVVANSGDVHLQNVLNYKSKNAFVMYPNTFLTGEHVTISEAQYLTNYSTGGTVTLTNSLLIAVTNIGTMYGANNIINSSTT